MLGRAMDFARPQGKCHVEKVLLVYNTTSYTIHLHTSRSARFLKLGISLHESVSLVDSYTFPFWRHCE